ncbi:MAG: AAA family ATPase, partial [Bacteroidota bacterium]
MDELKKRILQDIIGKDDVILTESQELALSSFLDFTKSQEELSTLLLRGSAGTGKTFLIDIFSRYLQKQGFKVILLAPTGRAAKVITQRTGRLAYTVHHHIYNVQESSIGPLFVDVKHNKASSRTVYIVDEASMVGDDENGAKGGLLHDILRYVFGTDAYRKLILVGDPIQLPPVGYADSPALNPDTLRFDHRLTVFEADLSEIKRQDLDSTILYNANLLRQHYEENTPEEFRIETGYDLQLLENAYDSLETF